MITYDNNNINTGREENSVEFKGGTVIKEKGMVYQIGKTNSSKVICEKTGQLLSYTMFDYLGELRLNPARKMFKDGAAFKNKQQELPSKLMSKIELAKLDYVSKHGEKNYGALSILGCIYQDITGIYKKQTLEFTKEEDQPKKAALTEVYNKNLKAVGNMFRRLTPDLKPVERAMLAISIGGASNFAFVVLEEEFTHMVIKEFAKIKFAGEKLDYCDFEVGEKVLFVAGFAESDDKAKMAKSRQYLTGEFTIFEYNDVKYAGRPLEDLIPIPDVDMNSILIRTQSLKASELKDLLNKLSSGVEIGLCSYEKDALVIGDEVACKFDCPSGGEFSEMTDSIVGNMTNLVSGLTKSNKDNRFIRVAVIEISNIRKDERIRNIAKTFKKPNSVNDNGFCPFIPVDDGTGTYTSAF